MSSYNCDIYSIAPFNSLKERKVHDGKNENPGPGNYASQKTKVVVGVEDKMNNTFTTKVFIFSNKINSYCLFILDSKILSYSPRIKYFQATNIY
jgi:hypothetical protein